MDKIESDYRFTADDTVNFLFTPPDEAPVFSPTHEQFANPLIYIQSIKPVAQQYGICKIKPPLDWQPPFAVDIDKFRFTPRIQKINDLEARTRIKLDFITQIAKFFELQGFTLRLPVVAGKILDLYILFHLVARGGGFINICKQQKWLTITKLLCLPCQYAGEIKLQYQRLLYPFEIFKQNKCIKKEPKEDIVVTIDLTSSESTSLASKSSISTLPSISKCFVQKQSNPVSSGKTYSPKKKLVLERPGRGVKSYCVIDVDPLAKYVCINCDRGDSEESMLLCDGCDDSYHTFCLKPPLRGVPKGDWRCPVCVTTEIEKPLEAYGFAQSIEEFSLTDFGIMADKFKSEYFGREVHEIPCSVVEHEYWRILSCIDSCVVVKYGADLHSMDHGSGFPSKHSRVESRDPETPAYLKSDWNLNNLPVLPGSALKFIKGDISGMKVPWMYVGMCFSTFCWHNEDHWSYSINYLHWGEPKTWYGVPGDHAEEFEKTIRKAAPELFECHPDLLQQLTTTLNPNVLCKSGIPVFRTDQQAGEFVITFPRAYHAGFNQGYNFAEAVNFAPSDWLPFGRECINYYSQIGRYNVFSHDELVCEIAHQADDVDPMTALIAFKDIKKILTLETEFRNAIVKWGVTKTSRYEFEKVPDDARQCDFCKTTCYLSGIRCECKSQVKKIACIRHYKSVCPCPPSNHTLLYRWTQFEIMAMLRKLFHKAKIYDKWIADMREEFYFRPIMARIGPQVYVCKVQNKKKEANNTN